MGGGFHLILAHFTVLIYGTIIVINRPASWNDPGIPFFHGDAALTGWKHLIDEVRAAGGKMGPQIWHTGAAASQTGWTPDAPVESPSGLTAPGEPRGNVMTEQDIADTVAAYGQAAADARRRRTYMPEIKLAHEASAMSEEQIDHFLQAFANGFGQQLRSPVMHSPSEQGLDYQDVSFPSSDGTPLEGWFIPAEGSNKLIIANHPMGFSRSGMPAQLEPWKSLWGSSGNDFEVNLIPDYKILHDAGYNVVTYDLRNFGHSSAANGGIGSSGIFESRDVLGSLRYVREREDTRKMTLGLFSRCLGCNSTLYAMKSDPKAFQGVRCLVGCQPVDTKTIVTQQLGLSGIPVDRIDDLDRRVVLKTSIGFDRRNQQEWAKSVCIPTFLYQVRNDVLTKPSDVQTTFDNIPVADKKLFWIEGTTRRWDGYMYFQREPEQMLEWFKAHMA